MDVGKCTRKIIFVLAIYVPINTYMINYLSHKTITTVLKQYIFHVTKYIIHNLYYMKKGFYTGLHSDS